MKNIIKTALVAIVAISFASCSGNKSGGATDSAAVTQDSSTSMTSGDTSKNMDSLRADTSTMRADTSTTKP